METALRAGTLKADKKIDLVSMSLFPFFILESQGIQLLPVKFWHPIRTSAANMEIAPRI